MYQFNLPIQVGSCRQLQRQLLYNRQGAELIKRYKAALPAVQVHHIEAAGKHEQRQHAQPPSQATGEVIGRKKDFLDLSFEVIMSGIKLLDNFQA